LSVFDFKERCKYKFWLVAQGDLPVNGRDFWTAAALVVGLCGAFAVSSATAEEPVKPNEEEVDPDVLRKVRKLVNGTISADEKEHQAAWQGLKDMGNLAVPGLLALYRHKDTMPEMIRSILIALGDSKDPRAGPALLEVLTSKDAMVRRDAARAIGDSNYKDGVKPLEKVAADEKEEDEVRLFAAVGAAKIGSEPGLKILEALLQTKKPENRSRAVFALGRYGNAAQLPAIARALVDADQSVREDAVEALRHLGKKEKQAWGLLVKAIEDEDYKVRNNAMDALRELTPQKFETPKEWQEWWPKAKAELKLEDIPAENK
jgi:HEAT repeat protein